MSKIANNRRTILLVVYITISLIIDFYPTYGRPHFRYTGSDPSIEVWNLGWPIATMIYDSTSGIHVGPFAYVFFPLQFVILAFSYALIMLLCKSRSPQPPKHSANMTAT